MTLMYLCQAVSFRNYCSLPLAGVAESFCFMVLPLPYPSWPCPHSGNLIEWFDAPDWEKRCLGKDAPVKAKFSACHCSLNKADLVVSLKYNFHPQIHCY